MKFSESGFSPTTVALAALLGLGLAGPHRGYAAPSVTTNDGPSLTLLSPAPHAAFRGVKPVEISAFYQSTPDNGIVSLDLYIDGVKAQSKTLDAPEAKGIVSFLVDASLLKTGAHQVVVRATATDAEVRSVKGSFVFGDDASGQNTLEQPATDGVAPLMRLLSPAPNRKVQGSVQIQVDAQDANGKTPYVSIFIDGEMKQLVNYRPFEYEWDTSALSNGWHTIAVVEAFDNDAQPVTHLKPIRVYVNNPGGATSIRHDLQDAAPAHKTTVISPLVRRPRGQALLKAAPAVAASTVPSAHITPKMKAVASAPAAPRRFSVPTTGFKPIVHAPTAARAAANPLGKHGQSVSAAARHLIRMAKAGLPEDGLSSPFLPLSEMPAATPHRVAVAAPQPALRPHALRIAVAAPHAPTPQLRIHLPQLPLHSPASVRTHVGLGSASLLRSVGEKQVRFNNSLLALERPLAVQQNVLFGPLRRVFEYGGGSLQWNAQTGTVRAITSKKDIRLTIGDKHATVNKRAFTLDSAPYLNSGRTMVPVSFLATAMDATVEYDQATGHLKITSRH